MKEEKRGTNSLDGLPSVPPQKSFASQLSTGGRNGEERIPARVNELVEWRARKNRKRSTHGRAERGRAVLQ
jgi:hypothetical protein